MDRLQVTGLLLKYQERFQMAPIFSEAEVRHYFLPVPDVIDTYVVEGSSESPPTLGFQKAASIYFIKCFAELFKVP